MEIQKLLLEKYFAVKGQQSYRDIAKETGIQETRVFRIVSKNVPMKLEEYLIFKKLIKVDTSEEVDISIVARECQNQLSKETQNELIIMMRRKLQLSSIIFGQ